MDDLCPPGPLLPPDGSYTTANHAEQMLRSFDELTYEKITAARHAFYAAAAEAVFALRNGQRPSGGQLFAATHAQASRAWWELVSEEITDKKLTCDHAVRRVRSWARHYLTGEAPAARPGTLFDHALAHASRMAARDFLNVSGQLLIRHLAAEPGDRADVRAPGGPVDHDRPGNSATPPGAPPTTAVAP